MGGLLRNYPHGIPIAEIAMKEVGCMKEWAAMGCNGRRGENEVRVGLPRGLKWCKTEGVICSEGAK